MAVTDKRGTYALVSNPSQSPQDSYVTIEESLRTRVPSLLRRRGRFLFSIFALICLAIFPLLVYKHAPEVAAAVWRGEQSDSLDATYLDQLASPLTGFESSNINDEVAYVVGEHHLVQGRYPDNYEWIDPYSRKPFEEVMYENGNTNSAIGRMPAGSPYDALVVARGRNDKYKDPREDAKYVNLTIVGFFANYNATSGEWERAGPEPYVLELPVWRQYPRPCSNLVNGGAADPRFIWSDAGEPLAIIGTASRVPGVCKAVGLVDLRAVWPALRDHMDDIGYGDIPIRFNSFTEVGKASKKQQYEKNWAPFFPGPKPATRKTQSFSSLFGSWQEELADSRWPLFASQVVPRTILEVNPSLDTSERSPDSYVLAEEIDLSMRINDTDYVASSDCLTESLPHTWASSRLHQATPYHRVTMCPRGACVPSRQNTVLLGLVHYKIVNSKKYRRMFVTMSTEAPFRILSVSPPLHFGSVKSDNNVVFSVSMAFFPTKKDAESAALPDDTSPFSKQVVDTPGGWLNHGWLDDTLVVGAGLRDEQYDSIHVPVRDALQGHTLCPIPS